MTTEHQHPHDHDLAAQVQELKPPGCTCHITERFINQPELGLIREEDIYCPIHYPETAGRTQAPIRNAAREDYLHP